MNSQDHSFKWSRYFTEAELAILTSEDVQLLTRLQTEDLPAIPEEEQVQGEAEYRIRIRHVLRQRGNVTDG